MSEAVHTTDVISDRRRLALMTGTFGLIALLAGVDLVTDAGQGASTAHWLAEGFLLAVGLVGAAVMARGLVRLSAEADRMRADATRLAARMESTSADAARWREEAGILIQGLGQAIDRQFDRWDLSDAEKEVALLLLKGLSHREVAGIRSTSEATTRQQARAVYRKAGVTGRNDLAAFFLEDLLLPMAPKQPIQPTQPNQPTQPTQPRTLDPLSR